jgi:hypothetical protein
VTPSQDKHLHETVAALATLWRLSNGLHPLLKSEVELTGEHRKVRELVHTCLLPHLGTCWLAHSLRATLPAE